MPARALDTCALSEWAHRIYGWPEPSDYKLGTVAAHLGIDPGDAHDALADCWTALRIARSLTGADARGDRSVSDREPDGPYVYQPFGSATHPRNGDRLYGVAGVSRFTTINGLTRPEAVAVAQVLLKMRREGAS